MGNPFSQPRAVKDISVQIGVKKITPTVLGSELIRRCGNEGCHPSLDPVRKNTLNFMRAAISFIPSALEAGADMGNAAFILSQPGQEFVIKSGGGDWEFFFSQNSDGGIYGKCVRKIWYRYYWDEAKSVVCTILPLAASLLPIVGPYIGGKIKLLAEHFGVIAAPQGLSAS